MLSAKAFWGFSVGVVLALLFHSMFPSTSTVFWQVFVIMGRTYVNEMWQFTQMTIMASVLPLAIITTLVLCALPIVVVIGITVAVIKR